jgi:hypothetical protein
VTDRDRLKLLCDIPSGESDKDMLLDMLLADARAYALSYCRRDFADEGLCSLIVQMAAEDYGRLGGEGVSYRTASGASESYRGDYSPKITAALRRHRRMRGVL